MITELEFKSLSAQGYNRIPLMVEAFADLETPLSLYLKLAHTQGGRQAQLPARIGGRRRALRPLQLHRPAGAHPAARQRLRRRRADRGRDRRPGGRDAHGQPARFRRRLPAALQGGAAARPAALLRRPGRLLRLRHGAPHREEAREELPARHAGLPRHPAAAMRGAGGHRQPLGQALPDRLRRPGPARGLRQRQAPSARAARPAQVFGERAAGEADAGASGRAQLRQGRLPGGGGARQGTDRGRRLHAGAGGPAHQQALHRVAAVAVPRAAFAQPVALHVLLPPGRFPRGRRLARDPGAPGAHRRGRAEDHHPPAGRHAPARRLARARQGGRGGADQRPEGARRARDADRPGAQRHRPHRQDRHA